MSQTYRLAKISQRRRGSTPVSAGLSRNSQLTTGANEPRNVFLHDWIFCFPDFCAHNFPASKIHTFRHDRTLRGGQLGKYSSRRGPDDGRSRRIATVSSFMQIFSVVLTVLKMRVGRRRLTHQRFFPRGKQIHDVFLYFHAVNYCWKIRKKKKLVGKNKSHRTENTYPSESIAWRVRKYLEEEKK